MGIQLVMLVNGCEHYKQFEAKPVITDLVTIRVTVPLDLVHIDFVNMETILATWQKLV